MRIHYVIIGIIILVVAGVFIAKRNGNVPGGTENQQLPSEKVIVREYDISPSGGSAQLIVRGDLPDSCSKAEPVVQNKDGNTLFVNIYLTRPADAACAQVITPYEVTALLESEGLADGAYTLDVNSVMTTFYMKGGTFSLVE